MTLSLFTRSAFASVAAAALLITGAAAATKSHPSAKHASHAKPMVQLHRINVDMDFRPHKRSSFGKLLGYDPTELHVRMGDQIQFVNVDDQVHTATGMSYTGQVAPAHYNFAGDPTKPHGRLINNSEWSTGTLRPHGGKSQVFVAKNVGHYFYGCSYHIGLGQIGVIVVGP